VKKPHMAKPAKPAMAAGMNTPRTSDGTRKHGPEAQTAHVRRRGKEGCLVPPVGWCQFKHGHGGGADHGHTEGKGRAQEDE
jgi:hypothetical protein